MKEIIQQKLNEINDYLDQSIAEIEQTIEQLPHDTWESLNSIFLNVVMH